MITDGLPPPGEKRDGVFLRGVSTATRSVIPQPRVLQEMLQISAIRLSRASPPFKPVNMYPFCELIFKNLH